MKPLRMGTLLYAQKIESLGNMLTKLGLCEMIGRCFLIIELMFGPSGWYCVVNMNGFVLLFVLFC